MSQPHPCYAREALPTFLAGEDPCQRLATHGAEALKTAELLAVLVGGKPQTVAQLLDTTPLFQLAGMPLKDLRGRLTPRQASRLVGSLRVGSARSATGPRAATCDFLPG